MGGFWGVVACVACFRCCAFPLVMLSRSIFSPLLAFRVFGCVLVGVFAFNAIVSDFKAFDGLLSVWRSDAFRRCARSVRDGRASDGVPTRIMS